MKISYCVIILTVILFKESKSDNAKCDKKRTCSECIQTRGCAWCSKVKHEIYVATSQISKCHPYEEILEICQENSIENPRTIMKVIANQPMKNEPNGHTIQLRPQEIFLKLKPEEEFSIDIEFKKAENYPVDLYYLMDFSSSMLKHKNHLSKLGNKLAETMKNLTTDFQLGFGSFVDKVVLPYTSTLPSHLIHPCPKCGSPYSFKNHMSLTKETNRFSVEVSRAHMSGNIDTPEGTLDAIMQAIVCQKQLNWREKARHIIVVSTDAPFHLAGDGKLGGVVEPHDGLCYLDENGFYTHSLVFDYPSISQINYKALDNNMNIIFAVVNKVKNEYLQLTKDIRGSSLGLLDAGENIAELIKAQYEKITTVIRLTDNAQQPVHITYSALCSKGEKWKTSNECNNVKGGSVMHFRAHIMISRCTSNGLNSQRIVIKPVGINETLTLKLETICDCQCSAANHPYRRPEYHFRKFGNNKKQDRNVVNDQNRPMTQQQYNECQGNEINSKFCSNAGDLICGVCACYKNRIGKNCECSGTNEEKLNVTDTTPCISNNVTKEICSGHGVCRCGECHCFPRQNPKEERTGKFCECDNYSCKKSNGLMCSGHGICKCGTCVCDPEWSGDVCDCPMDVNPCIMNSEEGVCSGKGSCVCGVCYCQNNTKVDEHRYAGKYCQICLTCLEQQCHLYNDCVECLSYGTGPHADNQCKNCSNKFQHYLIGNLEEVPKNEFGVLCVNADHSGCTFKYYYYYQEDGQLVVWAETDTICPKEINLYAVVGGTIGGTVLIGLLSLIIWKILVEIHDKREYEKFERERHLAKWGRGENPLFKTATTTYENPTYTSD